MKNGKEEQGHLSSAEEKIKRLPLWKKIFFSIIPLVIILMLVEVFLYAGYYYKNKGFSLATFGLLKKARLAYLVDRATNIREEFPADAWEKFYGQEGKDVLSEFEKQYDESFGKLVEETKKIKTKLVVLYVPSPGKEGSMSRTESRRFFEYISDKYQVELLDATDTLMKYPEDKWTLLPYNGHMSRFGNQILADYLSEYFKLENYRSDFTFSDRPAKLGDLPSNNDEIAADAHDMVYGVHTNKQGFRNDFNLEFPKKKQRILFLGDSFTFGPYLPNHDSYAEILNQKFNGKKEFINGGISGYTITDELSLFSDKAKYSEPDITVLQVLDNDLYGLFYFKKNQFDRNRESYEPSKLENDFLEKIKNSK